MYTLDPPPRIKSAFSKVRTFSNWRKTGIIQLIDLIVDDVSGEVVGPDLRPGSCKEADGKCQVLFTRHLKFGKGLKSKCYGNFMKSPGEKTEFLISDVKKKSNKHQSFL